jgi:hypothetical protein
MEALTEASLTGGMEWRTTPEARLAHLPDNKKPRPGAGEPNDRGFRGPHFRLPKGRTSGLTSPAEGRLGPTNPFPLSMFQNKKPRHIGAQGRPGLHG